MLFELHLTVDGQSDHWHEFCDRRGIKPLFIDLHGRVSKPPQLMCAAVFEGEHDAAMVWADGLERACHDFHVIRRKLEVPLDKSWQYRNPRYHECHVKTLLAPGDVVPALMAAQEQGWVASRNMMYPAHDGMEKWYFTQRCYGLDYLTASSVFRDAFARLGGSAWFVRMESETVIEDTNEALDDGWAR